jgi:2-keto-4-pentenoate hydratase
MSQVSTATDWAQRLEDARAHRRAIAPPTDAVADLTAGAAYRIARVGIDRRVAGGARVIGHKIGLTAIAVQQQLGVDQPDYGTLLDDMRVADGGTVDRSELIAPRVELELAFVLAQDLAGPGIEVPDVKRATATVQPAIEIVDSRILDWRISFCDTVADNASSARFVLGGRPTAVDALDTSDVQATLTRDETIVESGNTAAVLGDPCHAVAWLANALGEHGTTLRAGQIILSGACTRMVSVTEPCEFRGDFGALGAVAVSFADGGP